MIDGNWKSGRAGCSVPHSRGLGGGPPPAPPPTPAPPRTRRRADGPPAALHPAPPVLAGGTRLPPLGDRVQELGHLRRVHRLRHVLFPCRRLVGPGEPGCAL